MSQQESIEQFFHDADADGSGCLSLEELVTMLRKNGYQGEDEGIQEFFTSCDTDDDGRVSFDEYMAAMCNIDADTHKKATLMRVFAMFDQNGDGVIDKGELSAVFEELGHQMDDESVRGIIAMVDDDCSGTIDYREFVENLCS